MLLVDYSLKKKLLVVTSEYFHPLTTRLHHMLPLFNEYFDTKIVAITSSRIPLPSERNTGVTTRINILVSTIISFFRLEKNLKDNVIVLHYPFPENRFTSPFGNLFESIFIALIMKIRKIGKGYDVCLATPVFAGFPVLLAKIPMPIVYEDWDRFEFFMNNQSSRRVTRLMENYCIRNSAEVISAGYKLALSAKRERGRPVKCIPNGVNLKLFSETQGLEIVKDLYGLVYVGFISEWSGLEMVIESLPIIISKFPQTKLFIIGTGLPEPIKKLSTLAAKLNVTSSVVFLGSKKHVELPKIMKSFVIGLATFPNTKLMQFAFPLKIIEYMAAGLSVVATDVGDTGAIVRKTGCGVLVDYTPASIANGICRILVDQDYAESLAMNGQKWAKEFDFNKLAQEEAQLFLRLAENSVR
jgi:glycosyltransferase involved in cell wall biosynthesis